MENFQTLIFLMFAAAVLIGVAKHKEIPYPIILVIGGTALGFINIAPIPFNPNLLLIIVLPPVIYYASFAISFREFRKNWRIIASLAVGLVLLKTLVVAGLFKMLFPQYAWSLAFAFGAVVAPPDAISATTILRRSNISHRTLTILEGESLINDATAIVLYGLAVNALITGSFSLAAGLLQFIYVVIGGVSVGFILGFLTQQFTKKYLEPTAGVIFSFTVPYVTYVTANSLGFSGVLAVVTVGLMAAQTAIRHYSPLRRVLGYAFWDIFIILLNCFIFILIGLQLRQIVEVTSWKKIGVLFLDALLVTFVMILIRMIWIFSINIYIQSQGRKKRVKNYVKILKESTIMAWSSMRGIFSLTLALALPTQLQNGMPVEGRNTLIVITFFVIFLSLIIPGLTLHWLIRLLKIQSSPPSVEQITKIRSQLTQVAEDTVTRLHIEQKISCNELEFLKAHFSTQFLTSEIYSEETIKNFEMAKKVVIHEKRRKLVTLWENLEIDDKLLIQLEHELDLEEIHIARAEI